MTGIKTVSEVAAFFGAGCGKGSLLASAHREFSVALVRWQGSVLLVVPCLR